MDEVVAGDAIGEADLLPAGALVAPADVAEDVGEAKQMYC